MIYVEFNGPKITIEEICNKTFAYSYSSIRSIERTPDYNLVPGLFPRKAGEKSWGQGWPYCNTVVISKWKESWKKLNMNKLGTLTSFSDLVWQKTDAENIFTMANLPSLKSVDINLKYCIPNCQSAFSIFKETKSNLHG